jgi:DNA-binding beta-propeller fold protein YncE
MAWPSIPVRGFGRGGAIAAACSLVLLSGCSSAPRPQASAAKAATLSVGCSTQVASDKPLSAPRPITATVRGAPTAMVGTPDGRWAFASLSKDASGAIAVMAVTRGTLRLVRTVPLPHSLPAAYGMTLTHDGRLLLVADYTATAVLSVSALEDGRGNPMVGVLNDAGSGQFEVAVSADDRYVYVSDENTGDLSVFDLAVALRRGFTAPGVAIGLVPLDVGAVGVAQSPDDSLLYVTTYGAYGPYGQLWVIDAARADIGAGRRAVLAHVPAGCQPVRVAVSPDGSTAWVTAAQSNALLAFSAAELRSDPSRALRAVVRVGSEPVGLLLVDNGRVALVGNSNRGLVPGSTGTNSPQTVSVINTAAALAHRPATVAAVLAGLFPRDLSYDQTAGQVMLANFNSDTVEEFPVPGA